MTNGAYLPSTKFLGVRILILQWHALIDLPIEYMDCSLCNL